MDITQISKIFQPKQDLVRRFKDELKAAGVDIVEQPSPAKFFVAERNGSMVFVLAHESTDARWWGLSCDQVEWIPQNDDVKSNRIKWGAALLDGHPQKGYWIWGQDLSKLKELRGATIDQAGRQYHLHGDELDRHTNLVKSFFSIRQFLHTVGL